MNPQRASGAADKALFSLPSLMSTMIRLCFRDRTTEDQSYQGELEGLGSCLSFRALSKLWNRPSQLQLRTNPNVICDKERYVFMAEE